MDGQAEGLQGTKVEAVIGSSLSFSAPSGLAVAIVNVQRPLS
jgi:hypothetical protein